MILLCGAVGDTIGKACPLVEVLNRLGPGWQFWCAMTVRPASDGDLQQVRAALRSYAEIYSDNLSDPIDPSVFVDGKPQNSAEAGWLYYEGADAWFAEGVLSEVMPLLTMNILATSHGCEWVVIDETGEFAVTHKLLDELITVASLLGGEWLKESDAADERSGGELAQVSYEDVQKLLAKKRIFGRSAT